MLLLSFFEEYEMVMTVIWSILTLYNFGVPPFKEIVYVYLLLKA